MNRVVTWWSGCGVCGVEMHDDEYQFDACMDCSNWKDEIARPGIHARLAHVTLVEFKQSIGLP